MACGTSSIERMREEWTVQVCHVTLHVHCHVIEREVTRQLKHRICPHPLLTSKLQFLMLRKAKHLGHAKWSDNSGILTCACIDEWLEERFAIWLRNVNVGPSDVTALKFGTPLMFIQVQGSSRVPFSCSFNIAFDIRPFCLRTALVIRYAVSFGHIGMQFTLGIA